MAWRGVYISYPDWEEPSAAYDTKEKADEWLADKMKHKYAIEDWGYVFEEKGSENEKR